MFNIISGLPLTAPAEDCSPVHPYLGVNLIEHNRTVFKQVEFQTVCFALAVGERSVGFAQALLTSGPGRWG